MNFGLIEIYCGLFSLIPTLYQLLQTWLMQHKQKKKSKSKAQVILRQGVPPINQSILKIIQSRNPDYHYYTNLSINPDLNVFEEAYKIESWGCLYLYMGGQLSTNPMKALVDIKFDLMKKLQFFGVKIATIEALSKLKAPYLQEIRLDYNNITSIRPIAKISSRMLRALSIRENHISEGDCLTQGNWGNISCLWIESQSNENNMIQSVKFLGKVALQKNALIRLYIASQRRIVEDKAIKRIRKKVESDGSIYSSVRVYQKQ